MVTWTDATLMELKRSGQTENIFEVMLIRLVDPECGEEEEGIKNNSTLRLGSLDKHGERTKLEKEI